MTSKIAESLRLTTHPVAVIWSDTTVEGAKAFSPGKMGCVLTMFAQTAVKGTIASFSRANYGCFGGGVGLGFGNRYEDFPGGVDCFCHFLSDGNERSPIGKAIGDKIAASGAGHFARTFQVGEKYVKDAAITRTFVNALPMRDIPTEFVLLKPLSLSSPESDQIKSVTFFVTPDQLSALVVLASYLRPEEENVGVPWGAACQVAGIFAYRELEKQHPRALIGLTDISARKYTRSSLGKEILAVTLPFPKYLEMEVCVKGSFLEGELWKSLLSE